MNDQISVLAPQIGEQIAKATKILLCLHRSADPDSIGCCLATKLILTQMGKQVTLIAGDHPLSPQALAFPESGDIVLKTFAQITSEQSFDLFLALDSARQGAISTEPVPTFPQKFPTIKIDHHLDGTLYGDINLVIGTASVGEVLFELFDYLKYPISSRAATILYYAINGDSGSFEYPEVNADTFRICWQLALLGADIHTVPFLLKAIPNKILRVVGHCLQNSQEFFGGKVLLTQISLDDFAKFGITPSLMSGINKVIARYMNLSQESILIVLLYQKPTGSIGLSFRGDNPTRSVNVQPLGVHFGGGGHPGSSAGDFTGTFDQAQVQVLAAITKLYPDFGQP